ncbi:hypothetical protein BC937DRAFT_93015 [Endogone sp. FLAS-F59071]|nr:hypothetical protein BC937DRAFT_93015 [Endogone sp. FLAS-F59071]|eukprot:RUS21332.1 hypothetical protein BC937DRAFT_93015 [Endogone sp. FLAS-F59071]
MIFPNYPGTGSLRRPWPLQATLQSHTRSDKESSLRDPLRPRQAAAPDQFYDIYRPVFEREARFSKRLPVLELGGPEAGAEEVNAFYDFWNNFDSWRSFEYLDKEEGDLENRDDKRHVEKKNKAERAKRKKEDTARLRKIVDQALAADPRIKRIKDDERAARDAKKREKEEAKRAVEEETKKEEERKRVEKEKEEAEAKQRAENEKKDKEAKKKASRKERKTIKGIVKDTNYFCPPNTPAPLSTVDRQLTELDLLFEQLTLEETESLRRDLESHPTRDRIARDVGLVIRRGALSAPAFTEFGPSEVVVVASARVERAKEENVEGKEKEERPWATEELVLLIKAANKFPGGTIKRWEVIGEYVALHSGQPVRSQEELIRRSKEVRKGDLAVTPDIGAVALDVDEKERLQHHKKHTDTRIEDAPTIRYDDAATVAGVQPEETPAGSAKAVPTAAKRGKKPAAMAVTTAAAPTSPSAPAPATPATPTSPASPTEEKRPREERPWTAEDQAALERALQAYPPSWKGEGDRWEKVAEGVEGRTKRECKARVKYLTEQVKAKKAAAQGK